MVLFVDGCDGSGKTTLLNELEQRLTERYPERTVVSFRLPEDTDRCTYRSIIKKGPRKTDDVAEHLFFDLEDAFLNIACFTDFMRQSYKVFLEDRNAIVLCDRSLESIDCHQREVYNSAHYGDLIDHVRKQLLTILPNTKTFILQPPVEFVKNNLLASRDGLDDLDNLILEKTQTYMGRYRSADASVGRYVLRDPAHYVQEVFSILGAV